MTHLALFDLDGTLIDSQPLYFEIIPALTRKHLNLVIQPQELLPWWGEDARNWMIRFAERAGRLSDDVVNAMYAEFEQEYIRIHASHARQFDGIETMLAMLKQANITVGIVTTRTQIRAELAFEMSWGQYVDFVVGGDRVQHRKPAPDSIDLAIEAYMPNAQQIVYVGDNPNDIKAAHDSRYKVLGLGALWASEKAKELRQCGADELFEHVSECRDWLLKHWK